MYDLNNGAIHDYTSLVECDFDDTFWDVNSKATNDVILDRLSISEHDFDSSYGGGIIPTIIKFEYDYTTQTVHDFQYDEDTSEFDDSGYEETETGGEIDIIDLDMDLTVETLPSYSDGIKGKLYGNVNYDGEDKKSFQIRFYNTHKYSYENSVVTDDGGNYIHYTSNVFDVYNIEAIDNSHKYNTQIKAYTIPESVLYEGFKKLDDGRHTVLPNIKEVKNEN